MSYPVQNRRLLGGEFASLYFLGLVVAVSMIPLLHLNFVHAIDRFAGDLMMWQQARDQLAAPKIPLPLFSGN